MSYNYNPEWTKDIVLPTIEEMGCPTCGAIAGNVEEVMERLAKASYYEPRHIPPRLTFTCDNENCPNCDEDYYVELSVVVQAGKPKRG
ncbi:MAG: hypothetical protein HS126_18835 [Anaerolineales bacterium]|nr:hypothetical protein [Anaerolineales bacterium]